MSLHAGTAQVALGRAQSPYSMGISPCGQEYVLKHAGRELARLSDGEAMAKLYNQLVDRWCAAKAKTLT